MGRILLLYGVLPLFNEGHVLFCKNMSLGHIKLVFIKVNFPPPLPPVLYDPSLSGIGEKWKRSEPYVSNSIELMTSLTTLTFDFD